MYRTRLKTAPQPLPAAEQADRKARDVFSTGGGGLSVVSRETGKGGHLTVLVYFCPLVLYVNALLTHAQPRRSSRLDTKIPNMHAGVTRFVEPRLVRYIQ
jgi:hypothetical protein